MHLGRRAENRGLTFRSTATRSGRIARSCSTRPSVSVLAMNLGHAGVREHPARDRPTVKMPREERRHVEPPTAEHVEAVVRLLPERYRLPALLLDATGMRVGELEGLTWGDVDEPRGRWRVAPSVSRTGRPRLHRRRRPRLLTARPSASPRLPAPPGRHAVGENR